MLFGYCEIFFAVPCRDDEKIFYTLKCTLHYHYIHLHEVTCLRFIYLHDKSDHLEMSEISTQLQNR